MRYFDRTGVSRRALVAAAMLAVAPAAALAQDTGDAPPPTPTLPAAVEGAKSYTPADFTRFAPRTALEMLRQVPGFVIQEQDERRGLGQATSNVLINGQRFSGKSNDVVTELGRIPASNVTRIDIVDGATLDVPGLSGQVANIITSSSGITGSFAYRPQVRARRTPPRLLNGEVAVKIATGRNTYTLAAESQSFRQGNAGIERVFRPSGEILDLRDEVLSVDGEQPKISAGFSREGAGGSLTNLNGSFQLFHQDVKEISTRRPIFDVARDREVEERTREYNYELGGDHEFALGGGRLKLIGLRRFEHNPFRQTLIEAFPDDPDRLRVGDRFSQVVDETETIARGEYRWKAGGADWQVSAEGALNVLDAENGLFELDAAGEFVPVPLPNSVSTVKEKRAEAILSYGRPLSPTLTLQAQAGGEYSRITQSGEFGLKRTFIRPKGSVSVAWKASPRLDIAAKIEREVGQLNFFDFVASANVSGGTTNAGNANLVPQQSWNAEVQATRNLGPWGTLTARVYGEKITDIVDFVPIEGLGQAPGNLESATLYGIAWNSTFNLDPAGWRGARLDLELQFQDHSLTDPVTGVKRGINETTTRRILANFRHDIPETDWAYGASFDHVRESAGYRLDQRFVFYNQPGSVGIFVEHKNLMGLTVRGSVDNLFDTNESFTRTFYDGSRTGSILFTEARDRYYGPIFTLAISGTI